MASVFPGAIDSFSTYADNVDIPLAAHYNDMADAIVAIEESIGARLVNLISPAEVRLWAGSIADVPSGWLNCDGSAISRIVYADLFDVIGTQYGSGNGTTTFNLPDMGEKFPCGANADVSGVAKTTIETTAYKTGGGAGTPPVTSFTNSNEGCNGGPNHRLAGHDHTFTPPFVALVFIIKT